MAIITLPTVAGRMASWKLQTGDAELTNLSGVSQVTSYPDRRWVCSIEIAPRSGQAIREWTVALAQLALKQNVAAITPPFYDGPGTGYSGNATVSGASQLGSTLNVGGLSGSQPILKKGDFVSFDVTSAGGMTNRQLVQVTADVNSSGGTASLPLSYPIRNSPANGAAVNLQTPSAFFTLQEPLGGLESLELPMLGTFVISAIERIWP